jgi:hypothetical protein
VFRTRAGEIVDGGAIVIAAQPSVSCAKVELGDVRIVFHRLIVAISAVTSTPLTIAGWVWSEGVDMVFLLFSPAGWPVQDGFRRKARRSE